MTTTLPCWFALIYSSAILFITARGKGGSGEEIVCLYEEWSEPVETIENEQRLFEVIPKMESGTATENTILLHLYTDECTEDTRHPFFVGAHYQTGPSVLHLAQLNYQQVYPQIVSDWELPINCSLFVFIPMSKTYEQHQDFSVLQDARFPSFSAWISENRKIQALFTNHYGKKIKFFWFEKEAKFLAEMEPYEQRDEHTFLGHIFKATDAADDSFIDLYLIDGQQQKPISRDAMNEWCRSKSIAEGSKACIAEYEAEMIDWVYKFWARKREALNFAQPSILPNFTAIGFKKITLPDDVYQPVLQFWQNSLKHDRFVQEGLAGPVLNQLSSPTFMTHLPQHERTLLIGYFQQVLAAWGGLEDSSKLELTSLYGVRKYERGAVLHMHVDTCSTHVLSAIVNVDSKLDEGKDWPLQIYDHQGVLHEFGMKPGEAVFYESAKCGHSRRKPLPGDYYANLFIHFKPSGQWNFDWF